MCGGVCINYLHLAKTNQPKKQTNKTKTWISDYSRASRKYSLSFVEADLCPHFVQRGLDGVNVLTADESTLLPVSAVLHYECTAPTDTFSHPSVVIWAVSALTSSTVSACLLQVLHKHNRRMQRGLQTKCLHAVALSKKSLFWLTVEETILHKILTNTVKV